MLIGYARVSTQDQSADLQRDALAAAGCERVFVDEGASGASIRRPALDEALAALQPGDCLLVWKLDRLGRSLAHLVQLVDELGKRGIAFRSLSDPIDTTSAQGRLVLHIMGALAEFERALIAERTRAGLGAAKQRGQRLGRRPSLTPAQIAHARQLIGTGERARDVARSFGVSRSTLYAALGSYEPQQRP